MGFQNTIWLFVRRMQSDRTNNMLSKRDLDAVFEIAFLSRVLNVEKKKMRIIYIYQVTVD